MGKDLSDIRREYQLKTLDKDQVTNSPFKQLNLWLEEAIESSVLEPSAMTLATAGKNAKPSARIVLLKDITDEGLVFYTNYQSRKGQEMAENPFASLLFFWPELERQVRIEGDIFYADRQKAENYFSSRPRGSQIGAFISPQSKKIESREWIERKFQQTQESYKDHPVPKPDYWGGYILKPVYFEFWQGRESRIHDRIAYQFENDKKWEIFRLAP